MNAITRPTRAKATATTTVSTPSGPAPRQRAVPAQAAAKPVPTMDPTEYPKLKQALVRLHSSIYLAQAGVELLDLDEPKGLEFIKKGLTDYLKQAEAEIEAASRAACAIAPRLKTADATRQVVKTLVAQGGIDVPEADMPALVAAYEAESREAEGNLTCGVVLDRALRRMKAGA